MNHSNGRKVHVRRVLHIPAVAAASAMKTDDPLVLRRNYDISAVCGRESDGDDGAVRMHMHLSRTTPLWRCLAVGAAVCGVTAAVIGICRVRRHFQIRRKYARRYAERLRLQKLQNRCKRTQAKAVSDSAPRP